MSTNSGKKIIEKLLTSTVTQGGYITTKKRTMAVATLSNSDTTELLQQKNYGGCYFNQH